MARALRILTVVGVALLAFPPVAVAEDAASAVPPTLRLGVSLLGLVVAVVLLIEALAVRRVALGGAIAEKISYVILAILCLAASAIVEWTANFLPALSGAQIQLASQVLVIAAMALLAAYFFSVRSAMQRFLRAMTEQQRLAAEHADGPSDPQGAVSDRSDAQGESPGV